jgi:hypothetical protein
VIVPVGRRVGVDQLPVDVVPQHGRSYPAYGVVPTSSKIV